MVKFARALKTAFLYIFRNFGLSFASIIVMTLTFFIVSVVGLAFYGSVRLIKYIDAKPALTVFLRGDLDEAKTKEFIELVKNTNLSQEVLVNPIEFTQDDYKNKYSNLNPESENLTSVAKLPLVAFIYGSSQEDLSKLINTLGSNENFMTNMVDKTNIEKVSWYEFNTEQAAVIKDANKLLRSSGLAITLFLFLISSILIFITIKLTIQYHRKELEIMDLVGADGWFIKLPFIVDGMIYGILGGLLSSLIIWGFKSFVVERSRQLVPRLSGFFSDVPWPVIDAKTIFQIVGATCLVGATVGMVSSFFAIIKYVKK